MTAIGTVSHELGHYVAAKMMGFDARINYETTWLADDNQAMSHQQRIWFTLGGPLQTMLTGTIGLVLLFLAKRNTNRVSFGKWALIFLSLFWLRQLANFSAWIIMYLLTGKYSARGDEIKLSRLMSWSDWSIISITAFLGFIVLVLIIFKFIPASLRFTFIAAGLIGGVLGYGLWLVYLGEFIMP